MSVISDFILNSRDILFVNLKKDTEDEVNDLQDPVEEPLYKWERSHILLSRLIVYFGIFIAVFVIGGTILLYLNFNNSDSDSGRYFLSSLVQCQAAIISIVISLTLIAVQLTSQKYSFKTVDIFKKDPDLWILLVCYIISISYEFLILKEIKGSAFITENLGYFVSIAYLLGIFTLLVLIPYILNTINLLRSDTLILRLIDSINPENFPEKRIYLNYNPHDPVQTIFDVIHTSIKNYDISTLDFAITQLLNRMSLILQKDSVIRSNDTVSDYFSKNMERAGLLAIDKRDSDVIAIIIQALENFGKLDSKKIDGSNTISAIIALENLGLYSSEKNIEDVTHEIVNSIRTLGWIGTQRKIRNVTSSAISALAQIDRNIATKSSNFPRSQEIGDKIVFAISNIGDEIVRNADPIKISEDRYAICDPVVSLYSIAQTRFEKQKYSDLSEIIHSIGNLGYYLAAKCTDESVFERSFREVSESLDNLGDLSAEFNIDPPTSETIKKLGELAEISIERNLNEMTLQTISSLLRIYSKIKGKAKLEYSQVQFVKSLIKIVFFIRYKKIENPLSKEFEPKLVSRLKKIRKEFHTVTNQAIADLKVEQDLDPEKGIFEKIFNEIEMDS
jgi:hypothetical protein